MTGQTLLHLVNTVISWVSFRQNGETDPPITHKQTPPTNRALCRAGLQSRFAAQALKSPCGRKTQGCDSPKTKARFFQSRSLAVGQEPPTQRRPIKLPERNSRRLAGGAMVEGALRPDPARARSPRPAACAPFPTPVQPSLPRRPGSQNASQKRICLPPAEPHVKTREDRPHGARVRSFGRRNRRGWLRGRRGPGGATKARARTEAAPAGRTARPSGLRLCAARAEAGGLRSCLGLGGATGGGGHEPGDWAGRRALGLKRGSRAPSSGGGAPRCPGRGRASHCS